MKKEILQHILFAAGIALLSAGGIGTFTLFVIGISFCRNLVEILFTLALIGVTSILAGIGGSIIHYLFSRRSSF